MRLVNQGVHEHCHMHSYRYDIVVIMSEPIQLSDDDAKTVESLFKIRLFQENSFAHSVEGGGRYVYAFDKFHIFKLQGYDKVLFIDSDVLCVKDFLDIFTYKTPACVTDPVADVFSAQVGYSGAFWMVSPNQTIADALLENIDHNAKLGNMEKSGDMGVGLRVFDWEWNVVPRYYLMINYLWEWRGLEQPKRRNSLTKYVRTIHFSNPKPWNAGWYTRAFSPVAQYYRDWKQYHDLAEKEFGMVYNMHGTKHQ
jgi:hypothetical protein